MPREWNTEDVFHRLVAEYLDLVLVPPTFWTTFPAGSGGKARGGQLKTKGLKAGVPDILLVHRGRAFWIELKAPKGVLSSPQLETIARLRAAGCGSVFVARTLEDINAALDDLQIPYRKGRV